MKRAYPLIVAAFALTGCFGPALEIPEGPETTFDAHEEFPSSDAEPRDEQHLAAKAQWFYQALGSVDTHDIADDEAFEKMYGPFLQYMSMPQDTDTDTVLTGLGVTSLQAISLQPENIIVPPDHVNIEGDTAQVALVIHPDAYSGISPMEYRAITEQGLRDNEAVLHWIYTPEGQWLLDADEMIAIGTQFSPLIDELNQSSNFLAPEDSDDEED
ncbi:hypothetical protein [Nesterenkonia rhizosphaerae]|uniref:Uncharacterized protein n=1 Tax=Nesterenkonia rhizosphaerae TaxID=1348272 RepID=A0ABP9G0R2_9MICC